MGLMASLSSNTTEFQVRRMRGIHAGTYFSALKEEKDRHTVRNLHLLQKAVMAPSLKSNMSELLECPMCDEIMHPPIFQCDNGHGICSDCKNLVKTMCPTCQGHLGNTRSVALEKMWESYEQSKGEEPQAALRPTMQPFASPSTPPPFTSASTLPHFASAQTTPQFPSSPRPPPPTPLAPPPVQRPPFTCPYYAPNDENCRVTGHIPYLLSHLVRDHKNNLSIRPADSCEIAHKFTFPNAKNTDKIIFRTTLYSCFEQRFLLKFEAFKHEGSVLYIGFLHFLGEKEDTIHFRYSLEATGGSRKASWEGVPRSIRDTHVQVRGSLDGLVLHRNMALFFSGGDCTNLRLLVSGRIWQVGDHDM